jgi:methionyl-tRNA synthetase
MARNRNKQQFQKPRPTFPKRAVVTGGMPYGNKALHFGHIGGVFVHADTYARFLKDRIGKDNVIFVSGTDCYGSPILASHKQYVDSTGEDISLADFVHRFYENQDATLKAYDVDLSLYGTSAFGDSGQIHKEMSQDVFKVLYEKGHLEKMSTSQFYDTQEEVFLNGRQVIGKCPFEGCKSEKAYADECSLGHQYMPSELIDPVSILSGEKPELKEVFNWYFDLHLYAEQMQKKMEIDKKDRVTRRIIINAIEEFLKKPVIYVTRKEYDKWLETGISIENCKIIDEEKKPSVTFEFDSLDARDAGRATFEEHTIRYRTGKTLVPFRLSGNSPWGVPVPEKDGMDDLTFWVWPESLWAPISFTKAFLESEGRTNESWKDYWFNEDSNVYQFIGEDNVYFYGIAEMAMIMAYLDHQPDDERALDYINFPKLVANCHLLFLNSKASSSGNIKPPMAAELLDYYTKDQLRMHFLSLGLSKRSVSFDPKPFNPEASDDEKDVVLKDGNLLTNVFNRLLRSCFYTSQKYFDSKVPKVEVGEEVKELVRRFVLQFEDTMAKQEFHRSIYTLDSLIRGLSKYWAREMKIADTNEDMEHRAQVLGDMLYGVKCTLTLLHPITPSSAEFARQYLNLNESLWSWDVIFEPIEVHMDNPEEHKLTFIEPRFDFFEKHESQLAELE